MKKTLWLSRDSDPNRPEYKLWKSPPRMNKTYGRYNGWGKILSISPAAWAMFSDLRIRKGQCIEVVLKKGFELERVK